MTTATELAAALRGLRGVIAEAHRPLRPAPVGRTRTSGTELLAQIDDYLLPRLGRLDAPLLVVVGGSTGAGKSTLINSLVRAPVSTAGVLRPTTRAPVLVCSPADRAWFGRHELLPGLRRSTGANTGPDTLHLVTAPGLPAGVAFLDAPDIDSVFAGNRDLADQLFDAADLWLFVTTASRYADAVPWDLLRRARDHDSSLALVLDRVPADGAEEITAHLVELLAEHALENAPMFVLPETAVDSQGLLAEDLVAPVAAWFAGLASDAEERDVLIRRTLTGVLTALPRRVGAFADLLADRRVADRLRTEADNVRRKHLAWSRT